MHRRSLRAGGRLPRALRAEEEAGETPRPHAGGKPGPRVPELDAEERAGEVFQLRQRCRVGVGWHPFWIPRSSRGTTRLNPVPRYLAGGTGSAFKPAPACCKPGDDVSWRVNTLNSSARAA